MDIFFVAILVVAASFIEPNLGYGGRMLNGWSGVVANYLAWAVYAFAAGLPMTGLWVIAYVLTSFSRTST